MVTTRGAFSIHLAGDLKVEARWRWSHAARQRAVVQFIPGWGGAPAATPTTLDAWLDRWTEAGLRVLVVDPSTAHRAGRPCYGDLTLDEEIALHVEAWRTARDDGAPAFVFGHSLGAVIAPFVAATGAPRGVVVFGAVATRWSDALARAARPQLALGRLRDDDVERESALAARLYAALLSPDRSTDAIFAADPALPACIAARDVRGATLHGRSLALYRTLDAVDHRAAWRASNVPALLSITGELDWIADAADARRLTRWIEEDGGHATRASWPDLDHDGARFASRQESFDRRGHGAPHIQAADAALAWILSRA